MMNGGVLLHFFFHFFLLLICIFTLPFYYFFYFALIESETLSIPLVLIQENQLSSFVNFSYNSLAEP